MYSPVSSYGAVQSEGGRRAPDVAASKRAGAKRLLKACFYGTHKDASFATNSTAQPCEKARRAAKAEYPPVPSSFRAFDFIALLMLCQTYCRCGDWLTAGMIQMGWAGAEHRAQGEPYLPYDVWGNSNIVSTAPQFNSR